MKCTNCGAELQENHKFCTECGATIGQETDQKTDSFDLRKFFADNKLYLGAGVAVIIVIVALAAMTGGKTEVTQAKVADQKPVTQEKQVNGKSVDIQLNPGVQVKNWPKELIKKIYKDQFVAVQNTLLKSETTQNKEFGGHSIAKCTTELTLRKYPDFNMFNKANTEDTQKLVQELTKIYEGCTKGFVETHHKDANGNLVLKPREEKK